MRRSTSCRSSSTVRVSTLQLGKLAQRVNRCLQDDREQQTEVDVREVALLDERHRGHLPMRTRQVLHDLSPDPAHALAPALCRARRCPPDVGLGDPAAGSGAADEAEIDACLLRKLSDCRRRLRRSAGRGFRADHDEKRPDRDDLAFADEDLRDLAAGRRRDLDRRLVRRDLDERLILDDLVALGDEPARDLGLGQTLAEVGQLELVPHGRHGR